MEISLNVESETDAFFILYMKESGIGGSGSSTNQIQKAAKSFITVHCVITDVKNPFLATPL